MEKINDKNPKKRIPLVTTTKKGYGKHNFLIPSLSDIKRAMDYPNVKDELKKQLLPLNPNYDEKKEFDYNQEMKIYHNHHTLLYRPINIPKPSDWLHEHKESGQTFKIYSSGFLNSPSKTFNNIYINILDNDLENSFLSKDKINTLIRLMNSYYPGLICVPMEKHYSFKELNIASRENGYFQYNAGQTIEALKSKLPKKGLLIVGVTMIDIYPRDEWNFVYGLANAMEGVGVFSFRRHYDETAEQYDEKKNIDMLVVKKAAFTMIHEVGHLLGIKHCIYYNCLMNGHNHSNEKSNHFFCPVCLRKLQYNLKFDIKARYIGMLDTYTSLIKEQLLSEEDVKEETDWLKLRISILD